MVDDPSTSARDEGRSRRLRRREPSDIVPLSSHGRATYRHRKDRAVEVSKR